MKRLTLLSLVLDIRSAVNAFTLAQVMYLTSVHFGTFGGKAIAQSYAAKEMV
jgi:hypothetical protein